MRTEPVHSKWVKSTFFKPNCKKCYEAHRTRGFWDIATQPKKKAVCEET